jgi:hypothetical protein
MMEVYFCVQDGTNEETSCDVFVFTGKWKGFLRLALADEAFFYRYIS